MADASKPIFRKKSLERLSTPDRLDQLLHVVRRRMWLPLLALGGLLVLTLVWCFVGRIPITVDATAVLVHPREVVPLQAQASGELLTLVKVGETVKKGQVIATLARNDLEMEIELQAERLLQFQERTKTLTGFNVEQVAQEKAYYESQRIRLEARIEAVKGMAEDVRKRTDDYNVEQRRNLETTRRHSEELEEALKDRLESYERLLAEGLTSEDAVVNSRQRWVANRLALADIEVRLQEVELREIKAAEAYERQMDLVADLDIQLEQIQLKEHEAEKRLEEAKIHSRTDETEIERTIKRLEKTLKRQSQIRADRDGTVLEVTVSEGSMISAGQRIGTMAMDARDKTLQALAYFDIAAGKKIEAGRGARISPVTVQPQRYGSIYGEVAEVSTFPVTADAVVNQVGNRELAEMLVGDQTRIEVLVSLETVGDDPTALRWTSAGAPDLVITPGTTANVRVILEERAPITLLIPALRGWLGLD